ncbi:hypothetical protein SKB0123_18350 [Staphylococcus capitis]|nr:hypothetical protein GCM10008141_08480 [Staphylococcus capitis]
MMLKYNPPFKILRNHMILKINKSPLSRVLYLDLMDFYAFYKLIYLEFLLTVVEKSHSVNRFI